VNLQVEALATLRHPHVLPFLGACMLEATQFWLVTEYMEQGTLARWLHGHRHQGDCCCCRTWESDPAKGAPLHCTLHYLHEQVLSQSLRKGPHCQACRSLAAGRVRVELCSSSLCWKGCVLYMRWHKGCR
jgi:serine/threonine protein kinase